MNNDLPLGEKLFNLSLMVLVGCAVGIFVVGWILVIIMTAIPKTEPVIKWIFDKGSKVFVPVMKVSGLIALGLFIIRVLAGIFGWAPPLDTSEPGDFVIRRIIRATQQYPSTVFLV